MIRFRIFTLFPEIYPPFFGQGLLGRAVERGAVSFQAINLRRFGRGAYRSVDDAPFGGGAGMLIKYEVIRDASALIGGAPIVYLSPRGKPFTQAMAKRAAAGSELNLLCGHYEGIDQRALDRFVTEEWSLGDYVLSGGETASLPVIEAVSRLVPGFLTEASLDHESHEGGLLEADQYTRPREIDGMAVPERLLSGHDAEIRKFRRIQSLWATFRFRSDLFKRIRLEPWEFSALHDIIRAQSVSFRKDHAPVDRQG